MRMTTALPAPIAAYFQAKNNHDTEATLASFTPDATVVDEGESKVLEGHGAIREWLEGPIASYNLTNEVTNSVERDGETIVTALVSGDFPGSPIEFDYAFHLKGDKIDRLVIK